MLKCVACACVLEYLASQPSLFCIISVQNLNSRPTVCGK